ncbi:MAG: YdcF family protein [bacterium]|nr:YdcF family protein [bacterium]
MKKFNLVIILGGGIDSKGKLSKGTKERADFFLQKRFHNVPVLISGRCSGFLEGKPKTTEAREVKDYLIKKGINRRLIYLENQSLDTISNAVFSKKIIERHKDRKRIVIITSSFHAKRANYVFKKVFGKKYQISVLSTSSKNVDRKRIILEKGISNITKRVLSRVLSKKDLIKALKISHPFFSRSKEARRFLKEMVSLREKFLKKE